MGWRGWSRSGAHNAFCKSRKRRLVNVKAHGSLVALRVTARAGGIGAGVGCGVHPARKTKELGLRVGPNVILVVSRVAASAGGVGAGLGLGKGLGNWV